MSSRVKIAVMASVLMVSATGVAAVAGDFAPKKFAEKATAFDEDDNTKPPTTPERAVTDMQQFTVDGRGDQIAFVVRPFGGAVLDEGDCLHHEIYSYWRREGRTKEVRQIFFDAYHGGACQKYDPETETMLDVADGEVIATVLYGYGENHVRKDPREINPECEVGNELAEDGTLTVTFGEVCFPGKGTKQFYLQTVDSEFDNETEDVHTGDFMNGPRKGVTMK